uniref:Uncharacterized protein n=1 Tax=Ditylenchus dipsaci TaxID=166011 RepID=A0A915DHQ1_9BILA
MEVGFGGQENMNEHEEEEEDTADYEEDTVNNEKEESTVYESENTVKIKEEKKDVTVDCEKFESTVDTMDNIVDCEEEEVTVDCEEAKRIHEKDHLKISFTNAFETRLKIFLQVKKVEDKTSCSVSLKSVAPASRSQYAKISIAVPNVRTYSHKISAVPKPFIQKPPEKQQEKKMSRDFELRKPITRNSCQHVQKASTPLCAAAKLSISIKPQEADTAPALATSKQETKKSKAQQKK